MYICIYMCVYMYVYQVYKVLQNPCFICCSNPVSPRPAHTRGSPNVPRAASAVRVGGKAMSTAEIEVGVAGLRG